MTILFISKQFHFIKEEALKLFQPYTEEKDFHHFRSLADAKDFLIKNLIEKCKPRCRANPFAWFLLKRNILNKSKHEQKL